MRAIKKIWSIFRNFMIIFSFIVNIILLIVLIVLGISIFRIKNEIAQPIIGGLHSSFIGLNDATIDWTIPVQDEMPLSLLVPINNTTIRTRAGETLNGAPLNPGETVVTLTRDVPLTLHGAFIQTPDLTLRNASVSIQLPQGTRLPVSLDMLVDIQTDIPVDLDVRAVIPLQETQIHDPVENLRLIFEPLTRALYNLPDDFGEVGPFVRDVIDGNPPDLLAVDNEYTVNPWPGYSRTAGLGYPLLDQSGPFDTVATGIVPVGGIPSLDEMLRPEFYVDGSTPRTINERAYGEMETRSIDVVYFNGEIGERAEGPPPETTDRVDAVPSPVGTGGPEAPSDSVSDFGILPAPDEESGN